MHKEKVIASWYLEADTKMNTTLAPGNGPIRIIVIKRSYCFVFCISFLSLITKHTFYIITNELINYYRLLSNHVHTIHIIITYNMYLHTTYYYIRILCSRYTINYVTMPMRYDFDG